MTLYCDSPEVTYTLDLDIPDLTKAELTPVLHPHTPLYLDLLLKSYTFGESPLPVRAYPPHCLVIALYWTGVQR